MLLVIDVGNTNTVFALHNDTEWVSSWRSATDPSRTADDYAVWLGTLMRMEGLELSHIRGCIISSVVPQAKFNFRNLSRRYFDAEPVFVGDPETKLAFLFVFVDLNRLALTGLSLPLGHTNSTKVPNW